MMVWEVLRMTVLRCKGGPADGQFVELDEGEAVVDVIPDPVVGDPRAGLEVTSLVPVEYVRRTIDGEEVLVPLDSGGG